MNDVTVRPWRWQPSWDLYDPGQWELEAVWTDSGGTTRSLTIKCYGEERDPPNQERTDRLSQTLEEHIEHETVTRPWTHGILDIV